MSKLLRYLSRVYQGVEILVSEGLVVGCYELERFICTVAEIVRREKESQKGPVNQGKLYKGVKARLFEQMILSESHRKLFIGLVFGLAGEELLPEKDFDRVLRVIIRLYTFSMKIVNDGAPFEALLEDKGK